MASTVPVITVDGPAASGKGTIAAGVAAALGWHLLDSGALYRLVALAALERGVAVDAAPALAAVAATLDAEFAGDAILLGGRDVAARLRDPDVGAAASRVAVFPGVRQALFERQREFRRAPGLVADGRDMGTVVFPDAPLKVFVTASAEERAARRHKQLIAKGISVTIDSLLRELRERDERDANRAEAPLRPAPGALLIDTTAQAAGQSIAEVLAAWRGATATRSPS
ncbi:MAG: (d)CMP kinase [Proteobacteria bacterium]|nr:(d)CMP kinase [Pseudomonadota bacterium]